MSEMKKIYMAGAGGMLGEAFKNVFSKDYNIRSFENNIN